MKKILLVDDEDTFCMLYAEVLTEDGYKVISTSKCAGLLEVIEEHRPDLVVLDIRMGEYNGLDLLQDIRNSHYNMPVILCTAYSSFKHDLRSIAADYYVVKSADFSELKLKIKMAIESRTHS